MVARETKTKIIKIDKLSKLTFYPCGGNVDNNINKNLLRQKIHGQVNGAKLSQRHGCMH